MNASPLLRCSERPPERSPRSRSVEILRGAGAPIALALTALAAGLAVRPEGAATPSLHTGFPVVHASMNLSQDSDGDGLVDQQEIVLHTDLHLADTDGDGYSDSEELARGSSPRKFRKTPLPQSLSIGMAVHDSDSGLKIVAAAYVADGRDLRDKSFSFGYLALGQLVELPASYVASRAEVQVLPATADGTNLVIVSLPFRSEFVEALGELSVYATMSSQVSGTVVSAQAIDLLMDNGVLLQRVSVDREDPQTSQQGSAPRAGSVYQPIPPAGGGNPPVTWNPGEICKQISEPVGGSGASVIHEVVAADCVEAWGAFCRSNCGLSVGSTFTTMDPMVLVGL